jgi:predicted enzyme related to lactoylglutathione lyase
MRQLLINIDVPNLEEATRFYTQAFDLRVGRKIGDEVVELLGFPSPIFLLENQDGSEPYDNAPAARTYKRHWTPIHLDIVVDDADNAVTKARAAGAKVESEVTTEPWGRIALLSDPFGNGFCLIQFLGKGYDEISS